MVDRLAHVYGGDTQIRDNFKTNPIKTILTIFLLLSIHLLIGQIGLYPKLINKTWCYIDSSEKVVFKTDFSYACNFKCGLAAVEKGNKWGYIDRHGNVVIPFNFDLTEGFSNYLARAKFGEKWGYIDTLGKVIIAFQFNRAYDFNYNSAVIEIDDKYGSIGRTGNYIIAPTYDLIHNFSFYITPVLKGDKWGYIDTTGKLIVPIIYDWAKDFKEGFGVVTVRRNKCENSPKSLLIEKIKCKEKVGFADITGHVTMTKYNYAKDFKDGYSKVFKTPWWKLRWNYNIDWKKIDKNFVETDIKE